MKAKQKVAQAQATPEKIIIITVRAQRRTFPADAQKKKTEVQRGTPKVQLQQKAAQVRRETKQSTARAS
jgi:hypothetical protein